MPDSFFYAAKPRLSEEPRPMQTLQSYGAAGLQSSQAPPSVTAIPASFEFVKPRSLCSLGHRNLRKKSTVVASDSLLDFLLDFNMQTLHSSHPSLGAASRLSLLSLGRFAPSAKRNLHSLLIKDQITRLISYKRKGLESQRRLSDLPRPRWGTSHLRASHGRASLVTLKRKGRMSYRRYRNLHTTCCILQHLQQSCCRTLCLVPLKRKDRLTVIDGIKICIEKISPVSSVILTVVRITGVSLPYFFSLILYKRKGRLKDIDGQGNLRKATDICSAPSLVVAGSSSLTRYEDAVFYLISHVLKRREKKKYSLRKDESRGRQSLHVVFVSDAAARSIVVVAGGSSSFTPRSPIPLLDLFGFGHAEPASRKVRIRPFPSLAPLRLGSPCDPSPSIYYCLSSWVWFLSLPSLGLRSFRLVLLLRFAPLLPAVWLPWTLRPWWSFRVALPGWIQ